MLSSLAYQDLLVSLDYQQLLLRAPLPSERNAGQGILNGDFKSLQTPDEVLIESIAATSEYYADTGGTTRGSWRTPSARLLMRAGLRRQELQFLALPQPHDATWQAAVAQSLVDGTEYRTDFIVVSTRSSSPTRCALSLVTPADRGRQQVRSVACQVGGSGSASSSAC